MIKCGGIRIELIVVRWIGLHIYTVTAGNVKVEINTILLHVPCALP